MFVHSILRLTKDTTWNAPLTFNEPIFQHSVTKNEIFESKEALYNDSKDMV